jgi:Rrf2 family cysteine metabolism transcriptional repressor
MKLSTKGRYGSRAMLDLALNSNAANEPITLNSIAERQNISEQYLEQIFSSLRKSGLVESVRGAQGGYRLGRAAEKITVGDIVRVLEGSLDPVDCISCDNTTKCERYDMCVMKDVWKKVSDNINSAVDSFTLADLVKQFHEKNKNNEVMFYI